ncbi:PIG-L deacetylase family protein [Nocardia sp. NBC_01327]|uniref:PIG-L deacetylase family protein n=1 Tax=Nocardia sp. NBC_01327 TaxID=2903593 RepID=UPI002E110C12|nr:PIG-L family deacetylase [Nocardia sp. NBC_01327]
MSTERFADSDITTPGTPLSVWQPWIQGLPEVEPTRLAHRHLQIVAPHPDDEVLGIGGLASFLAARGVRVTAVIVTDGEASHPDSPTHSPVQLAEIRAAESADAATILGIDQVRRLGLPDGAVTEHEQRLAELLDTAIESADTIAIPLRNDGHPDHEATARAALVAAGRRRVRVIEYPIWLWHWSFPADTDIAWTRARRVALPDRCSRTKRRAAAAFHSQLQPLSPHPADRAILPEHVIERLLGLNETVFL